MDYMPAKVLTKQASTTYGPPNLGVDTASNFGLAVVSSRSDKPDYSMTKGGLRLWLSVALFLLLLSAFTTLTSRQGLRDLEDDESQIDDHESHKITVIKDDDQPSATLNLDQTSHSIEPPSQDHIEEENQESTASLVEDELLAKLSLKAKERLHDDQNIVTISKSPIVDSCEMGDPDCNDQQATKIIKVRKTKGKLAVLDDGQELKIKVKRSKGGAKSENTDSEERKIRVRRTKGKATFEDRSDSKVQDEVEAEVESDQQSDNEAHEGQVLKPDIKIKVKRTKGTSSQSDHSPSDDKDHISKPDIKIKVKRTKGASNPSDQTIADDQPQNEVQMDQDMTVKVHRTKGKSNDEQPRIKVYKTKGSSEESRKLRLKNEADQKIADLLDHADQLFEKGDLDKALKEYESLIIKYPKSPLANYGKAKVLDRLSEKQKSNQLLEQSIREYDLVLNLNDVTDDLYMLCAERLVDRLQFRGWLKKSINIQEAMLSRFPHNVTLLKQYGLTFLMLGQSDRAQEIFRKVLKKDPDNGHTLALYGFVLKTMENRLEESIDFLYKGVKSNDPQAQDARFYFHLGDALQRLNRAPEAYEIYEQGVNRGFFISKYQRSLYNVPNLKSRPWWSYAETTYEKYLKMFENEWKSIRDEALSLLDEKKTQFKAEDEKLTNKGDWRQFTLFVRGRKIPENCARAPKTCSLASKVIPAASCTRGQIKFSLMHPGTKVWPHCGPTNCRIRAHLGLVVPPANQHPPRIRVANETRTWKTGKFIIFDDSFEHEVWYDDDSDTKFRLVLIVDFWHPDLTFEQRSTLDPI